MVLHLNQVQNHLAEVGGQECFILNCEGMIKNISIILTNIVLMSPTVQSNQSRAITLQTLGKKRSTTNDG